MERCCCFSGVNTPMLFLIVCAIVEYVAHTVVLLLAPMVTLHFYPETSFQRLGFYTAILSGSGFLGHALSCKFWINLARSLKSSKGVILWGLAVTGAGFFSLLLCTTLLAMSLVRFAIGLSSGVLPVALAELDNISGNRQTRLILMTKTLGVGIGAIGTYVFVTLGDTLSQRQKGRVGASDSTLYFFPFCFVSILASITVVVTLVGLRLRGQTSYKQLAEEDNDCLNFMPQVSTVGQSSPQRGCGSPSSTTVDHVKSALEMAFKLSPVTQGIKRVVASSSKLSATKLLAVPQPHYRRIRDILPHYVHGYTSDGNLVMWDLVGRVKMEELYAAGFTEADICNHYRFFFVFAREILLRNPTQKIVYVVDLDGLSIVDADARIVNIVCAVVRMVQCELPNRLQALAVLNSPVWFTQVMAKIRPHVAKRTADKMLFVSKETLMQDLVTLIGVDSLPQRYGGRNGVEIGKSAQERSLDDLIKRTTSSLDRTIEIVTSRRSIYRSRGNTAQHSTSSDDSSDEEAFFDCSEYGLQDHDDVMDQKPELSVVVHSQSTQAAQNNTVAMDKDFVDVIPTVESIDPSVPELTITREPMACLVLVVYLSWSVIQLSFDELLPLWFFNQISSTTANRMHDELPLSSTTVSHVTLKVAGTLASWSVTVLFFQTALGIVCSSVRNIMSPLATLRLGLLLEVPILGCFPLIGLLQMKQLLFYCVMVTSVLVAKYLVAGVALQGTIALLDNSVAVDRRLAVHRAAQGLQYLSHFIASAASPALFALLGHFEQPFPFDQNLLYLVQALGLIFLLFLTLAIPSRVNFPYSSVWVSSDSRRQSKMKRAV